MGSTEEERKAPAPQFHEHGIWLDLAHDVDGGSLQDLDFDIGQVVLDSVRSDFLECIKSVIVSSWSLV